MNSGILELVRSRGLEPKHLAATHGGEWASPCPLCGGRDRFRVWPEQEGGPACSRAGVRGTWYCRQCERGGDVLQFLLDVERLPFGDACRALKMELPQRHGLPRMPKVAQTPVFEPKTAGSPATQWRTQAAKLIERSHAALLQHEATLAWLEARGIPEAAVRRFRLGLLEGERDRMGIIRPRSVWGLAPKKIKNSDGTVSVKKALFIPRGIVIPTFDKDGLPRSLRVRRSRSDVLQWGDKYMVVEGSAMAPLFLGMDRRAVVVVEAELDAMAVAAWAGDLVGGLAVLTNRGKPDATTHARLAASLRILVALDFDKAGAQGWGWWRETYATAMRWPVPEGKDPGDYAGLGGDLRAWVLTGLPPVMTLGASDSGARGSGAAQEAAQVREAKPVEQGTSCPQPGNELYDLAGLLRRKHGCLWLSRSGGGRMLGGQIDAAVLHKVSELATRPGVLPCLLDAGRLQEEGVVMVDAVDISDWLLRQG